jgi:hypothetical protein
MRRNGGLGRSAAALSGVQPVLRRPQDGTQIERVFGRKKAQNLLSEPFAAFRGNPQSAIRNPQSRRTHDGLQKLMYLMIPTRKSGFTRFDCAWTWPSCGKSSQPTIHQHLTHKIAAFPMKKSQTQSKSKKAVSEPK